MAFCAVLAINSFHGHAILAVLALDGDAVLAVDADSRLTVLAIDADAAGSARLAIFAILAVDSKLFSRDVLVHLDGDVAIFIDLGRQVICGVFMTVFLVGTLNLHRAAQLGRIVGARVGGKGQALVGQISLSRFQLRYIDCISVFHAGFHVDDATGNAFFSGLANSFTNGDNSIIAIDSRKNIAFGNLAAITNGSGIADAAGNTCIVAKRHVLSVAGRSIRTNSDTLIKSFRLFTYCYSIVTSFGIMSNRYGIRGRHFLFFIRRANNDIVLRIRQGMVIPEDDVGLILVHAVATNFVVRADDIVMLAIGQFILETINIVVLCGCSLCVGAILTGYFVADADNLSHIGFVNSIATAHDHDLAAAGRNGFLQILSHSCRIFLSDILFNLAQVELRGINSTIRIGDRIACTIDDGGIRVSRRIGLTDNAVSYTAMLFRDICVLVDVECTIGQSRCTTEVKALCFPRIDDTGVRTGHRRSNAVCMGV